MSTPAPKASNPASVPVVQAEDARRAALLEASFTVFARFGFRKTSMDEVARAAQISRQGLYLHFSNKEDLFRATVIFTVESSLAGARRVLDSDLGLEERLLGAYDAWVGRFVGRFGIDAVDLVEAAEGFVGSLVCEREKSFNASVAALLREAGVASAYERADITELQLAEALTATAKGLKHGCQSREQFLKAFGTAVRIQCAPVLGAKPSWGQMVAKCADRVKKAACSRASCRKKG